MLNATEVAGELRMSARRSHGSSRYVADLQRGRMLSATFALVGERGYEGVTARSVSERAGVSNRTFYQCFSDREDCFLAALNHAVDGLELDVRAGWESELGWTARTRAALGALLIALDREPALARLLLVEALSAGPRVLSRRAGVLEQLAGVVDQGRATAKAPATLPALVAEGIVGATFGVIHSRVLELRRAPLIGLLGQLMATIVLPYRGSAAAAKELQRPIPRPPAHALRRDGDGLSRRAVSAASPVDYRLTVRTQMALAAVAGRPGLNNREVSEIIGLSDQGQISRMMKRLSDQGLIENAQGQSRRQARAWRLTRDGEAVIDAHRPLKQAQRKAAKGGKLTTTRSAAGRRGKSQPAGAGTGVRPGFRMTALTHEVLGATANLSAGATNPSNRAIATATGVKDQGQISKLLARLEGHGLLENTGGSTQGIPRAWQLTPRGEEILHASQPKNPQPHNRTATTTTTKETA